MSIHHPALPAPGQRIVVIGVTGCGKTALAQQLARRLGYPHVELDALHWGANWTMAQLLSFESASLRRSAGRAG